MLTPCAWAEKSNERKMVIINKHSHTKRHTAKRKSSFLSTLSLVLAVLMMLSVSIAGIPTASAKGESAFVDNECIYIDVSQALSGGGHWDDANAELRVFTYYNDSNDANYCHEFEENFATDGWFDGANVLQKGIMADKFSDHIYRFRIPSDKISHVRIARTNQGATKVWNVSKYMWDNQRSKTAGSKSNCIKITDWGEGYNYDNNTWSGNDNNASWSSFAPTNKASFNSKTAQPDSTITGNSNLYTVDAKFYDYYNDDEIQKGWQNINNESNHATVHYTKNNSWYWWAGYWEPFSYFNKKIADQANSNSDVIYPMYFGNFYGKGDGYTGEGKSDLKKFNNQVNNSNNIGGVNKSVTGLTGGTLNADGNLVYAKASGYNSDTLVPFFDDNFLSTNKVGSVISSKFPMRKVVENGITTYKFDSTSGKDNVWINNSTGSNPTVSYAENSQRAIDSLYSYSNQEANGYGFFPFDGNRSGNITAKNYGFGMRVDVDFNLGSDTGHLGQIKGTNGSYVDQVFSFSGDDDVWVYVDGKLILDLGGDHKKTTGSINFHTKQVTANTGATFNGATRNQSNFTLENEDDPTAEHTLTMFYVERGMIESNLSFNFNFAPVSNQLIAEKQVNTTELNDGIKNVYALKNADQFNFTSDALNGKSYTYAHTASNGARTGVGLTVNDSSFKLRDKDTATFADQLTVGTTVNVAESFPSDNVFTYGKTSWVVVDTNDNNSVVEQSAATETQSLNSSFVFKTNKTGTFDPTKLKLTYTNTPDKANAVIKKNVIDSNSIDVSDSKSFTATVSLSFDKGATYNTYPLKYSVAGTAAEQTMSNGQVTLQEGKDITINNLPVGTRIKVKENAASLGGYTDTTGEVVMEVTASGVTQTITNKQPAPDAVSKTITAKKTFDGQDYNGTLFKFGIKGLNISGDPAPNAKDTTAVSQEVVSVSNGTITFDQLTFTEAGVYRYFVYEDTGYLVNQGSTYAQDITKTSSNFIATITVTKSGTTLTASDPVFRSTNKTSAADITASDLSGESLTTTTFTNVAQKGSLTINKTNQSDEKVGSVKFALYKIEDSYVDTLDRMSDADRYDAILALDTAKVSEQTTNTNGVAEFSNLDIYEEGYTSAGKPKYQNYALIEIGGNADYHINKTPQMFTFPTYDTTERTYKYHYEFDYVNGMIRNPYTAGNGMNALKLAGMFIVGMSLLALAGFVLYKKRNNKSFSKAKHYK